MSIYNGIPNLEFGDPNDNHAMVLRGLRRLKIGDSEGGQIILSQAVKHIKNLPATSRAALLNQEALSLARAALLGLKAKQCRAEEALSIAKKTMASLEALQLKLAVPTTEPQNKMHPHHRIAVYLFQAIFVLEVMVYTWEKVVRPVMV